MKQQLTTFIFWCLLGVQSVAWGQTPAVQWGDMITDLRGGIFYGAKTSAAFFTVAIRETTNSRTISLNRYSSAKLEASQVIFTDNCATCTTSQPTAASIYASPDGGVLVYFKPTASLTRLHKFNSAGVLQWQLNLENADIIKASYGNATSVYLLVQEKVNAQTLTYAYRINNTTGVIASKTNVSTLSPTDLVALDNNNFLVSGAAQTAFFTPIGESIWQKPIVGGTAFLLDATSAFIYRNSRYQKIFLADGVAQWMYDDISVVAAMPTGDGGVLVARSGSLIKMNGSGSIVWQKNNSGITQLSAINATQVLAKKGATIETISSADGTTLWSKTFNQNLNDALKVHTDGQSADIFVTTQGTPRTANIFGTGLLYHLAPTASPCSYAVETLPSGLQKICKTGQVTLRGSQQGLSLLDGLPTTDFSVSWWKNDSAAISNELNYKATTKGKYQFRVSQGNCEAKGNTIEVKVIGLQQVTATAPLAEICIDGAAAKISATGCAGNSVVWSGGILGDTLFARPRVNTTYRAACKETYISNGQTATCVSDSSNAVTINVLTASPIIMRGIYSPDAICEDKPILLDTEIHSIAFPVIYEWLKDGQVISNKALNLEVTSAGSYQAKVLDARGCRASTETKQIAKNLLTVSVQNQPEFCQGTTEPLKAVVTGGIGTLTYLWTQGGTAVGTSQILGANSAGTYYLKVTDSKGCFRTASTSLMQNPRINGAFAKNVTVKGNLLYEFNPNSLSGGTGSISHQLAVKSVGGGVVPINGNKVGTFTSVSTVYVSATDAKNCRFLDSVKINYVPCSVNLQLKGDSAFCYNKSVDLFASLQNGVSPFKFQWFKNDTLLTNQPTDKLVVSTIGRYRASVSDSALCNAATTPRLITEKGRNLFATISPRGDSTAYSPFTVKLDANAGTGFTYRWFRNDTLLTAQTNNSLDAARTGRYRVEVMQNGCTALSRALLVSILTPLGTELGLAIGSMQIFPTPTYGDRITVRSNLKNAAAATLAIFDFKGQQVWLQEQPHPALQHEWQLDATHWPAGTYLLQVRTDVGVLYGKVVKL